MRNIFDQYRHIENRVSHALAHAAASDSALSEEFARFLTGERGPLGVLQVSVQRLPDAPLTLDASVEEAISSSLPDIWFVTSDSRFCCAIENKVETDLVPGQLQEHLRRAHNLGFPDPYIVAITGRAGDRTIALGTGEPRITWKSWEDVYKWLHAHASRPSHRLVTACNEFLMLTEQQVLERGSDVTMTTFTGVPFDNNTPYNYLTAKHSLRWLRDYLAEALDSNGTLPQVNPTKRRPKVTDDPDGVWDVVGRGPPERQFTSDPHLTVEVAREFAAVGFTVPNRALTPYWKQLRGKSPAEWEDLFIRVHHEVDSLTAPHQAIAELEILQRHYPNRAREVRDAHLVVSLDAIQERKRDLGTKTVMAWTGLAGEVVKAHSRANIQLSLRITYPYRPGSTVHEPEFKDEIVRAAQALLPFYDFVVLP